MNAQRNPIILLPQRQVNKHPALHSSERGGYSKARRVPEILPPPALNGADLGDAPGPDIRGLKR